MSRLLKLQLAAAALCCAILGGVGASPSLAVGPPGTPTSTQSSPSTSSSWTFSWAAAQADPGFAVTDYEGGFDDDVASFGPTQTVTLSAGEGSHTFRVRAVQTPSGGGAPAHGPFASATIRVDTQGPNITPSYPQPNGIIPWYRSPFTVSFTCTDPSGVASCVPSRTFTAASNGSSQGRQSVTGKATDSLGNTSAPVTVGPFSIDMLAPPNARLSSPSAGAVTDAEPTFTWARSKNRETSGYQRYELEVLIGGSWLRIESVPYPQPPARPPRTFSATRNRAVLASSLPERTALKWRVTTFDNAGNQNSSKARSFSVDSSAPPSTAMTQGPSGPVGDTAPTFAWTGDAQASYVWSVSAEGDDTPVQSGSGPATSATLGTLPDGDYVFSVAQVSPAGVVGIESTRFFTVDTVAPPPPTITAHPPVPTLETRPAYAWSGEEESTFRWQVVTSAGASAQSPVETPFSSTTVGPFTPGSYTFRISQIDPAGNVSGAATDPFTIAGAVLTAVSKPTVAKLPAVRASRLRPKAFRTLMTRRPTLSWTKGPRGTRLYNVQVFRAGRKGTSSTKVTKVFSRFPRARHVRLPTRKIRPGYCYVWRVWPYVKKGFTKKPLGVSNFCVGTPAQLKAAARAKAVAKARAKAKAKAKARAKAKAKAKPVARRARA